MQDKYSLAYAMAKDGRDIFGGADGERDADLAHPGALGPNASVDAAALMPLSDTTLALATAGFKLNELSQALGVLRENVDSLVTSLSLLKAADARPVKTQERAETTKVAEFRSTYSEDRRLTREAMTVGAGQSLDPLAALRYSNANLSFETKDTSQKSITVLREESTESEKRLSKTLEPVPILLEETWLKTKAGVMDTANDFVSDSPTVAKAAKTAEAVISPLVSGLMSGLGETIKTRVAGNVVDVTLGKLPYVGKLFQDGGYGKEKATGKECCCPGALSLGAGTGAVLDASMAKLPDTIGDTVRDNDKARPGRRPKQQRGKSRAPGKADSRAAKASVPGKSVALKSQPAAPRLNAMGQPLVPFDAKKASQASVKLPGSSFSSYTAAPSACQRLARRSVKGVAASVSGALARLESVGGRRLGPMKYVDTAMVVAQGVSNGDAKAIGSGLSTAGGAWAGASAGAAIGTMIFPGVGTAVGGAIGGLLGSEAGTWLGDKLFGPGDRLPPPSTVSKELNAARTDNVQVTLAPSIQITGVNPADAQQVVNQVIQALQFQCMPMVTDTLGVRRNAALTDPAGGD